MAHSGWRQCCSSDNDVSLPLKSYAGLPPRRPEQRTLVVKSACWRTSAPAIRETGFMEYVAWSFRLDVGPPDHLCPLRRVVRDELLEIGGRAAKHCASLLDKPGLDNGIGDSGVDLPVELLNHLAGRAPRRANSIPCTRLIARYEIAHSWDVRQCFQADRRGHCQGSNLAGANVLNRCA